MSSLYKSFLDSLPSYRYDMVNELLWDEDITISPYILDDEYIPSRHDSIYTDYWSPYSLRGTISTDSSLALSRAMTDSDIDYDWFRRLKSMTTSRALDEIQATLDAFPPGYIPSLYPYYTDYDVTAPIRDPYVRSRVFEERLRERMRRYFDRECCVYTPDDPGLLALQDAIDRLDNKILDSMDYLSTRRVY